VTRSWLGETGREGGVERWLARNGEEDLCTGRGPLLACLGTGFWRRLVGCGERRCEGQGEERSEVLGYAGLWYKLIKRV